MNKMANLFTTKNINSIIHKRVTILPVPDNIKYDVERLYTHIRKHNGSRYAVDKFKVIKQVVLNYAASDGQAELPKDIWMKKRNKHLLKGPIGRLQKYAASSPKTLERSLKLLNCYTVEVELKTTQSMIEKFRETVSKESSASDVERYSSLLSSMKMKSSLRKVLGKDNARLLLTDVKPSGNYFMSPVQKPHQEHFFLWQMESFLNSVKGRELRSLYPELFSGLPFVPERSMPYQTVSTGVIHRIASPGLKDRWVLDFSKPLEHILHPMGKRVYNIVSQLPWDITFEEEKCYAPIQEHFRNNGTAYAVDLSNATDRFPWDLQYSLLTCLFSGKKILNQSVHFMNECIKLPSNLPDGTQVRWEVGQPLGAYPSFGVFTLTHGCLLFALNGYQWDNDFFVHGDDVVILNDSLYNKYIECLTNIGVDFNPFKTLVSKKYTEINSKVISAKKVHTIPKWKPFKMSNILDSVRFWGTDILQFVLKDPDKLALAKRICALPYPFGAGLNPEGLPSDQVSQGLECLFEPNNENNISYIGSYRSLVSSRFTAHTSDNPNLDNLDEGYFQIYLGLLDEADKADEALSDIYYMTLGHVVDRSIASRVLGKNVYDIDPNLDIPIASPKTHVRTHVSRLNHLLRKVALQ